MGAEENKQLIRNMYQELAKGNPDGFLAAMADDVEFTIIGTTKYSGTYRGKKEVIEKLLVPITEHLEPGSELTPHHMMAEGDYVAMQATGKARTKSGKRYDNVYCQILRIEGGKVKQIVDYLDTELVTAAFGF
jgi:ketosteroid isomerase-like protein